MDSPQQLPTVLSLCSGYAGIERGLELAGFAHRTVAYVEVEAFAAANLVAKMEEGKLVPAPVWTDLKTLPAQCFRDRVDLLTGGYPCQPFSAAGKRKGAEDPRHLWPHIKRHVETIRPVRCFFENVEGHISLGLREVIADLEELGYATTWGIFSAAEVGAPHQRKRVYILAHSQRGLRGERIVDKYGDQSDERGEATQRRNHPEGSGVNGEAVSHAHGSQQQRGRVSIGIQPEHSNPDISGDTRGQQTAPIWLPEPNVGRVVNGSPDRMDRLRLLGNGVVPQTAALAWVVLSEQIQQNSE